LGEDGVGRCWWMSQVRGHYILHDFDCIFAFGKCFVCDFEMQTTMLGCCRWLATWAIVRTVSGEGEWG